MLLKKSAIPLAFNDQSSVSCNSMQFGATRTPASTRKAASNIVSLFLHAACSNPLSPAPALPPRDIPWPIAASALGQISSNGLFLESSIHHSTKTSSNLSQAFNNSVFSSLPKAEFRNV